MGQEHGEPEEELDALVTEIERDPLAGEVYLESEAEQMPGDSVGVSRADLEEALQLVNGLGEIRVKVAAGAFTVTGLLRRGVRVSALLRVLEKDRSVEPLVPESPVVAAIAERLQRKGERLPLVIGSCRSGAFRAANACWVGEGDPIPVTSLAKLKGLLDAWSGEPPSPAVWLAAEQAARRAAERRVAQMQAEARERERQGLEAQIEAARHRLLLELGRYLVCVGEGVDDLNGVLYRQLQRETTTRARLTQAYEKLGGYPDWDPDVLRDLAEFTINLSENERKARLLGKELDAALQDPRWQAAGIL